MQIVTCASCGNVVKFSLMADAESPQTLFDLLMTQWDHQQALALSYDNMCNLVHYTLNREPERLKTIECHIDALHARCHRRCLTAYDTSAPPH